MPTVAEARNLVVNQIVDGVDNSITPSKVRQVMLAIIDSLSILEGPGFTYSWSTTTTAGDPGSATIRGNNATQASITNFYFSETSNEGNIQGYLAAILGGTSAAKGVIIITDVDDHDNFIAATVTSDTDSGAYRTLAVNTTSAGGAIADGATVIVQISPVGDSATPTLPDRLADNPTVGTDWNNAILPGWYRFGNGSANQPTSGVNWGCLVIPGVNANNCTQIAVAAGTAAVSIYTRDRSSTVWGSWLKLALTQAEQDGRYLKLAGGTLTGDITMSKSQPTITASKSASTQACVLAGKTNGVSRWAVHYGNGAAESGANNGSNFSIYAYDDSGDYIGTPFEINRATNVVAFSQTPTVSGNVIWHAGNKASAAEIRAATSGKGLDPAGVFAANAWVTATYAATVAIDQSTGFDFTLTLTGNCTLGTMTNKKQQSGIIEVKQDATGGRTLAFSTDFVIPGGTPTIDTAANARNFFAYRTLSDNKVMLTYLGSD